MFKIRKQRNQDKFMIYKNKEKMTNVRFNSREDANDYVSQLLKDDLVNRNKEPVEKKKVVEKEKVRKKKLVRPDTPKPSKPSSV